MVRKNRVVAFAIMLGIVGFEPVSAVAQESDEIPWYEQRHGELRLGGFFIRAGDTNVLLESNSNPLAATVNFRRELGLDSEAQMARLRFVYQFTPRHGIDLSYFNIERDGQRVVFSKEIEFGDLTIPIGASVNSFYDTEILKLAYANMFYRSERVRLGFSAGLNLTSIDIGASFVTMPPLGGPPPSIADEQADAVAPLPVVGGRMSYSISPKWIQLTTIDVFAISTGSYSGTLTNLEVLVENRVSRRWGWGGGLEFLSFNLNATDSDLTGAFQTTYRGVSLYATVYF